jgi:hypothetical protein
MRAFFVILIASGLLSSCGKPSNHSTSSDPCMDAKGAPGIETDAQAQQACRDNRKFLGPDAKPSKTKIENN